LKYKRRKSGQINAYIKRLGLKKSCKTRSGLKAPKKFIKKFITKNKRKKNIREKYINNIKDEIIDTMTI